MNVPATGLRASLAHVFFRPRPASRGGWQAVATAIALGALATLVYLLAAEMLLRVATRVPLTQFNDLRAARGQANQAINTSVIHDPVVGWRLRPFVESKGFNTIEQGLRSNGNGIKTIRTGGVLAVGSSFTAGSEVDDHETWPAHLEKLIGRPVQNGGQGNFSADQIIMYADMLAPMLKPEAIVVDLLADNILGAGYSSYAWPKPYFTVGANGLVQHNNPVPNAMVTKVEPAPYKAFFARSAIIDRVMSSFAPDYWLTSNKSAFIKSNVDEVEVTCLLLQRLKKRLDADGVRLLLYLQFAGSHVIGQPRAPGHALLVRECAEQSGIEVVDEFDSLKAAGAAGMDTLRAHYVTQTDGSTGHKSSFGNLEVARRVEAALAKPPEKADASVQQASLAPEPALDPAELRNLIPGSEALHRVVPRGSHFQLSKASSWFARRVDYRLSARGKNGEHYAMLSGLPVHPGTMLLSMDVKAETASRLRIQLRSEDGYGVITDFDLKSGTAQNSRLADTRTIGSGITATDGGWYRVFVRASFPPSAGKLSAILQLADAEGRTGFLPNGEAVLLRSVQMMRGREVRPYQPTERPQKSK